jgi:hypothetical protein
MRVRFLFGLTDEVRSYDADEVVEVSGEKAARFIAAGFAVAAEEAGVVAATAEQSPERATLPRAAKRGE